MRTIIERTKSSRYCHLALNHAEVCPTVWLWVWNLCHWSERRVYSLMVMMHRIYHIVILTCLPRISYESSMCDVNSSDQLLRQRKQLLPFTTQRTQYYAPLFAVYMPTYNIWTLTIHVLPICWMRVCVSESCTRAFTILFERPQHNSECNTTTDFANQLFLALNYVRRCTEILKIYVHLCTIYTDVCELVTLKDDAH